ncbi:hypothetical protein B5M09_002313 [Aphanomyces astaci]|uniref:Uncharacterized protein n=1 Tax=Aphanomyces astaci TaxID=112090 RepID=A0A3R7YHG1_APHAT|nr:hypothetical protein B5M09_002313 [Aphanomyces astaci]
MQNDIDLSSAASIALGVGLGGLVILVLSYFPGEPFDYSIKQEDDAPASVEDEAGDIMDEIPVEKAASALRVDKLQELLGLEESKIRDLVAQAKRDTLNGISPTPRVNYMARADRVVYFSFFMLMCYFAWRDYGLNVLDLVAYLFPTETATLRQILPLV